MPTPASTPASTPAIIAALARTTPVAMMPPVSRRLVSAMRIWASAHRAGRWPVAMLHDHIGCARAAAQLQLLVEQIGQAWPDPFCLAPPCCRQSSHDETLIAAMVGAAAAGDRPAFDRGCAEMLGPDVRDRLYATLAALAPALARSAAATDSAAAIDAPGD